MSPSRLNKVNTLANSTRPYSEDNVVPDTLLSENVFIIEHNDAEVKFPLFQCNNSDAIVCVWF